MTPKGVGLYPLYFKYLYVLSFPCFFPLYLLLNIYLEMGITLTHVHHILSKEHSLRLNHDINCLPFSSCQ